jgi:imidazole glycerol-phosphate synthase subunit HisH
MRPPTIGIVDYGVGNLASVWHALHALGLRCRVSGDQEVLGRTDLLLLPGVGAFPTAMQALRQHGLDAYLQDQAAGGKPILGICLGMQLLAQSSLEHRPTAGLGLVGGQVQPLPAGRWHIGWNILRREQDDALFASSEGKTVYFNHSYALQAESSDVVSTADLDGTVVCAAVRRANVVGLQFHPEKSQAAGRALLRTIIRGFCP